MSSNNCINKRQTIITDPYNPTNEPIKTFLDAQFAYATSNHSKAEKSKKTYCKKVCQIGRGGRK